MHPLRPTTHADQWPTPVGPLQARSSPAVARRLGRLALGGLMLAVLQLTGPGLALLAPTADAAERLVRPDRDQPLEIDAGQVRIDGKRKLRLLSGGVEIRRGSLLIKADQVELRETASGEVAVALGSAGQPARFSQKRPGAAPGSEELLEGQAVRIDYDGGSETVKLDQQAQLRRWVDGRLSEDLSGQTIHYDHLRDTFEVVGGAPQEGGGRVRAVVAPRLPAAGASAPAAVAPRKP